MTGRVRRRWQATVSIGDVIVAHAWYAPTMRRVIRKAEPWAVSAGDRVSVQRRRRVRPVDGAPLTRRGDRAYRPDRWTYFTHRVGERQHDGTLVWTEAAPPLPQVPQP